MTRDRLVNSQTVRKADEAARGGSFRRSGSRSVVHGNLHLKSLAARARNAGSLMPRPG